MQVPILNSLMITAAVAGNHDFDWSAPHFSKLAKDSNYVRTILIALPTDADLFQPWLLSNIVDTETGKVPKGSHEFHVIEKAGLCIGIVGLVEELVDLHPSQLAWY